MPEPTKAQIEPHLYSPDYMAMGDCRICGHVYDSPVHIRPTRPHTEVLAEAREKEGRRGEA